MLRTMTNDQYTKRALALTANAYTDLKGETADPTDFYVVWFCKTLGNWKALVSTDLKDGLYWEVTHNGAKAETYIDTYNKVRNKTVKD